MSKDVSVFGVGAYLSASVVYPIGVYLNTFSDERDGISIDEMEIGGISLDLNGQPVSWQTANPVMVSIGVIPHSVDDSTLGVLFNSNRVNSNTTPTDDDISLVVHYPDGTVRTFTNGKIIRGTPGAGTTAAGRLATTSYYFGFGDMLTTNLASALNVLAKSGPNIVRSLLG